MRSRSYYRSMLTAAAGGLCVTAVISPAVAAFEDGTVIVLRVGDGTGSVPFDTNYLSQPISLDVYDAFTGGFVAAHSIPSVGPGAVTLTSRNDDHDGRLNFSGDGQFLTFGGYRAAPGSVYSVTQSASSVPRVAARVDGNWNANTSTALTDAYDKSTINSVVTTDGNRFWTGGAGGGVTLPLSGGLRYVPALGSNTSVNIGQTQATGGALAPDSMRNLRLTRGQLYINTASQGSYGDRGVWTTNTPLPATAVNTPVPVTRLITNHEGSSTDYAGNIDPDGKGKLHPKSDSIFLDQNGDGGFETCYSTGGKDELEKWTLTGSNWLRSDVIYLQSAEEINALDFYTLGSTVDVLISTDAGVYRLPDTGGIGAIVSSDVSLPDIQNKRYLTSPYFIPAGANTQFRGLAVIVPEPLAGGSVLSLALIGSALRSRRRK